MQEPKKRSSTASTFWGVAVAVLAAAVLALAFAPLAACPRCNPPWNFFEPFETWDVNQLGQACKGCGGSRKVSLWRKWVRLR